MYETNQTTAEFLFTVYVKLEIKINRIIELTNLKKQTYFETKELYETRSKLLEILNILNLNTNSQELKKTFEYLAKLLISNNIENLKIIFKFCKDTRNL